MSDAGDSVRMRRLNVDDHGPTDVLVRRQRWWRRGCQDGAVPNEFTSFPPEVAQRLKTYVYRLIDPRNGETFYVGKGQGNRVFAHIREQVGDDDPNLKLKRIRDIRLAGFEVAHVIHRHGLDDRTAYEAEAALMDAYPV
jgi:hypothetical protein